MNPHLQRATLLIDQARYPMAEDELRLALAQEPQSPLAHALLARCLCEREQYREADQEIQQAIHLGPDQPFVHYMLAHILSARNRLREALAAGQEAVRLDPYDPDYYAVLSALQFNLKQWPAALQAADEGLKIDAEHTRCANLRAMALVKLGRAAEARVLVNDALARNPEDHLSHANQGWVCLEQNQPQKALEHFREALRLDPDNQWARQGIVEALKARHLVYAIVLKYFFWMSKLSTRAQWGVVLLVFFTSRALVSLCDSVPELKPWLIPLRILLVTGVLLTWLAQPLSNLLLRLNRFGRLALTREQIVASNWVGADLALALLSVLLFFVSGHDSRFLLAALLFGVLVIPLAAIFKCSLGWPRRMMILYTAIMALLGFSGMILLSIPARGRDVGFEDLGSFLFGIFILAMIASPWIANILLLQRVKR